MSRKFALGIRLVLITLLAIILLGVITLIEENEKLRKAVGEYETEKAQINVAATEIERPAARVEKAVKDLAARHDALAKGLTYLLRAEQMANGLRPEKETGDTMLEFGHAITHLGVAQKVTGRSQPVETPTISRTLLIRALEANYKVTIVSEEKMLITLPSDSGEQKTKWSPTLPPEDDAPDPADIT